jgi:hypothetical protein
MNSEQLAEEVVSYRSTDLSPVSPKPIHYPQPSNIPLLDLQMAAAFGQAGLVPPFPPQTADTIPQEAQGVEPPANITTITHNSSAFVENASVLAAQAVDGSADSKLTDTAMMRGDVEKAQPEAQIDTPNMSAVTLSSAVQSDPPASAQASHDAAMAFLQSLSIPFPSTNPLSNNEATPQQDMSTDVATALPESTQSATGAPADDTMSGQPNGGVVFDTLLDKLSTSAVETAAPSTLHHAEPSQQPNVTSSIHQTPIHLIPTAANLPPRPNVQQVGADVRPSSSYQQQEQGQSQRSASVSAGVTSNGLSAVHNGTVQHMVTPPTTNEDEPFSPDLQKQYEEFLATEAKYMIANEWDKFPPGSRLFVGRSSNFVLVPAITDTTQAICPQKLSLSLTYFVSFISTANSARSQSSKHMASYNIWMQILVQEH